MSAQYPPGHVLPGTVYSVIRHLATGGMGSLYEVEDTTVGRKYVLKTLHPELVDRTDLAIRMRDEARSLGKLHHANIVQVITAGVTSEVTKVPFYVMELLVGQNLRSVLAQRGALAPAQAYRIVIDVADALQHAHENAMVHRDVKPENIFLHRGSSGTVTKLLDFGIVRLLDRQASLTRGKFIGTLRYASPEQVLGKPVGPATDVYSLGLVLYELLRGRGPFDDAGDAIKIGSAHVNEEPPPLLGIAADVAALVRQTLAKDPEARPRSAAALAAELRKALRQDEASARATTELDLLSARHPLEEGPPRDDAPASSEATVTATPTQGSATEPIPRAVPLAGPATRVEGVGVVESPVSSTLAAPRGVDREAPTRMSPQAAPQPRPANDTRVEAADAVNGAPAAPPSPAAPPVAPLAPARADLSTVRTRPIRKDRTAMITVGIAAALALMMIAGAVLFVRARPGRSAPPAGAAATP